MNSAPAIPFHLAYVFERFPSFTQTFCAREILELESLGIRPLIFSIHDTRNENIQHFPQELFERVHVLPPPDELIRIVKRRKDANEFPQGLVLTLRHWGNRPDKLRVYEAAYIGSEMQRHGIRHAHSHFAGMGARACWWMRQFYGHTFSFTGHANDIFCATETPSSVPLSRLVRDSTLVITVSDYSVQRLSEKFPKASRRIRRVYNGLDLAPFKIAHGSEKASPPEIVSVGRLIEKKGFDDLIRAIAIVTSKGVHCICKIAGEGPMENDLKQLIADHNCSESVQLLGPQSQDEIAQLFARASIFALPCVTETDGGMDNLPTVIMEAMAASLPCVSTRLAGVPEMIDEGKTGYLVDERQPEAFANALISLLEKPELRRSMGASGLARAKALFAKEVTARHLARHLVRHGTILYDPVTIDAFNTITKSDYARQYLARIKRALTGGTRPRKRPLHQLDR